MGNVKGESVVRWALGSIKNPLLACPACPYFLPQQGRRFTGARKAEPAPAVSDEDATRFSVFGITRMIGALPLALCRALVVFFTGGGLGAEGAVAGVDVLPDFCPGLL